MRLLQSRQWAREPQVPSGGSILGEVGREAILLEETESNTQSVTPISELEEAEQSDRADTDSNSFVIFEHKDENTLI